MADKCDDVRFEQAGPPDQCDPAETADTNLRQQILSDAELAILKGLTPSSPINDCVPVGPDTNLNTPEKDTSKLGSTSPEGPYVIGFKEISELCRRDLSPQILTGIILQLLVNHFGTSANIFNKEIEHLIWSANPRENNIRITSLTKWSPEDADLVPAVIVSRGQMQFERIAIGDKDILDIRGSQDEIFTRTVTGSHTITCVGGTPAETEILGFEVVQFFTIFSPVLRRTTPIYDFQVAGLGGLVQIDEMSNKLGVNVSVTYKYPWVWAVQEQAPILKAVTLKV